MGISLLCLMIWSIGLPAAAKAERQITLTSRVGTVPPRPELYDQQVEPLSMKQCAQCHIGVFTLLAARGTRHQLECTFCHQQYHTYAPGKVEYREALPQCIECHGRPHGDEEAVRNCSACHSNAHTPLLLPAITVDQCQRCHSGPPAELAQQPSKHSEVACTDCHTSHGVIPGCADCHSEQGGLPYHLTGVEDSVCLACHPVHTPLAISYPADAPQEYCAPCHKNESHQRVLNTIRAADSKHNTEVTCATCHDTHGKIPECFACHQPHKADQTAAVCLTCHADPHAPLNITYPLEEPQESCAPCHGEVYDELQRSQTRHTGLTCAACHPSHGQIPRCEDCHGTPHGEALRQQFETCGGCHGIAHNVQGRMK